MEEMSILFEIVHPSDALSKSEQFSKDLVRETSNTYCGELIRKVKAFVIYKDFIFKRPVLQCQ